MQLGTINALAGTLPPALEQVRDLAAPPCNFDVLKILCLLKQASQFIFRHYIGIRLQAVFHGFMPFPRKSFKRLVLKNIQVKFLDESKLVENIGKK